MLFIFWLQTMQHTPKNVCGMANLISNSNMYFSFAINLSFGKVFFRWSKQKSETERFMADNGYTNVWVNIHYLQNYFTLTRKHLFASHAKRSVFHSAARLINQRSHSVLGFTRVKNLRRFRNEFTLVQ